MRYRRKKFTFAISSPDNFLLWLESIQNHSPGLYAVYKKRTSHIFGGKRSLGAYIAVCPQIHCNPRSRLVLTDSSTGSPVHVLMLSIQAVCGLPRLRAPCIVPCIISFSSQLPCFLMVWPQYASFLALTVSNSSLFTPALLRTHSFVFFAVHETRRIFLSPIISKASIRVSSFFQLLQP